MQKIKLPTVERYTTPTSKHEHEFQDICSKMEKYFKDKIVWTLPHIKGHTDCKLKQALEICQDKGITNLNYLRGILKRII